MEYKEDEGEVSSVRGEQYDGSTAEDSKRSDEEVRGGGDSDDYDVNGKEDVAAKIEDSSPPRYGEEEVDDTKYKRAKGLSFEAEEEGKEDDDEEEEEEEEEGKEAEAEAEEQAQAVQQAIELERSSTKRHPERSKSSQFSGELGYANQKEAKKGDDTAAIRRHIRQKFNELPLTVCPFGGITTNLVQCVIIREKGGGGYFLPSYSLFFQGQDTPAMVAVLQGKNKTTNYHIFDMTRGVLTSKLSKKSGNYMGKLRSNFKKTENCLYTNDSERQEVASIMFNRPGLIYQLKEGSQPRKLNIFLPAIDSDGCPQPVPGIEGKTQSEILRRVADGDDSFYHLETKEPVFENGNYRLNFHGRVTIPSVKNYQLTPVSNINDIVCQFGKVGNDRFHLDFKRPMNCFQAFAIALTQFAL